MSKKQITLRGKVYSLDAHGFLSPPEQWDEDFAEGMAEVLGISRSSLSRWCQRQTQPAASAARPGRPHVIPEIARHRLRECYVDHYGQWGPRVLALWARREGLGRWSPETIARVIAEGKHVTYDMKPDRNDPTAVGTKRMAQAVIDAL